MLSKVSADKYFLFLLLSKAFLKTATARSLNVRKSSSVLFCFCSALETGPFEPVLDKQNDRRRRKSDSINQGLCFFLFVILAGKVRARKSWSHQKIFLPSLLTFRQGKTKRKMLLPRPQVAFIGVWMVVFDWNRIRIDCWLCCFFGSCFFFAMVMENNIFTVISTVLA